ncbi:MAG TPA: hypothetical protein VK997_02645 [Deferrisomatales bacterium]|nr:hypothetical protein [Deferrisomatales bacterium]
MRRINAFCSTILLALVAFGCAPTVEVPEELTVTLAPDKGYTGAAQGTAVINTRLGTEITFNITGLDPAGLYTAFLVNPKSQMFEGLGAAPHVLPVDSNGAVSFTGKMKKDSYKRFVQLAVYANPGGKAIENPVGVKAALGELIKEKKPTLVLVGKLR